MGVRHGIRLEPSAASLPALLREVEFDHLASIAHLSIIPADALRLVRGVALNFHDGPLPELAGLNVTTWAILRGERTHGVTWHLMTERADEGRILVERRFDIAAGRDSVPAQREVLRCGPRVVRRRRTAGSPPAM